jgi:hypothetical protein
MFFVPGSLFNLALLKTKSKRFFIIQVTSIFFLFSATQRRSNESLQYFYHQRAAKFLSEGSSPSLPPSPLPIISHPLLKNIEESRVYREVFKIKVFYHAKNALIFYFTHAGFSATVQGSDRRLSGAPRPAPCSSTHLPPLLNPPPPPL